VDVLHLLFQPRTLTASDPGLAAAARACRDRLGAPLTVSFGEPGAVTATGAMVSWKAARVVDRRVLVTAESVAAQEIASRRTQ
jgi:phenylacetate-CoA ligase